MGDVTQTQQENTIPETMANLWNEVSRLEAIVFGETLNKEAVQTPPVDKITGLINSIQEVAIIINRCNGRLSLLGK